MISTMRIVKTILPFLVCLKICLMSVSIHLSQSNIDVYLLDFALAGLLGLAVLSQYILRISLAKYSIGNFQILGHSVNFLLYNFG